MMDVRHEADEEELVVEGNLDEASTDEAVDEPSDNRVQFENSELADFDAAEVLEIENLEDHQVDAIVESLLFASDKAVSIPSMRAIFKDTNVKSHQIRESLGRLARDLEDNPRRGVMLVEHSGGYQIRTKTENQKFLVRNLKAKPFRLSGPALEVLAIVAYKQPVVKSEIDSIRGVESGHLLRALMEKSLVQFGERSELPGKPMQYLTSKKFLEIFGLRNLNELPSLAHIDDLMPQGIGLEEDKNTKLADLTDQLSEQAAAEFSVAEEELTEIVEELSEITTTTEFFEREKEEMKKRKLIEKAQSLREALLVGEEISTRDRNWLMKYDEAQMEGREFSEEGDKSSTGPELSN